MMKPEINQNANSIIYKSLYQDPRIQDARRAVKGQYTSSLKYGTPFRYLLQNYRLPPNILYEPLIIDVTFVNVNRRVLGLSKRLHIICCRGRTGIKH